MNKKRMHDRGAKHWFFFRAGEPAHCIASRAETQLLTVCGLHFHPLTATPMRKRSNCPRCRTCVRFARR